MGTVASGRCRCTIPREAPVVGAVAVDGVGLLAHFPEPLAELAAMASYMRWEASAISGAAFVTIGASLDIHPRPQASVSVQTLWALMAAAPASRCVRRGAKSRVQWALLGSHIGSGLGYSLRSYRGAAAGHVLQWFVFGLG